jgi:hypothetical protein
MRTHPSWGEGSGVFTGLAEALRALNGGYIDFDLGLKAGVDGFTITDAILKDKTIQISVDSQLAKLKSPYRYPNHTQLVIKGLKQGSYDLSINGAEVRRFTKEQLEKLNIKINPDGKFEIN